MFRSILLAGFVCGTLKLKELVRVHAPRVPLGRKAHEPQEIALSHRERRHNDDVERRGIAPTLIEATLSQSSTPSWFIEAATPAIDRTVG